MQALIDFLSQHPTLALGVVFASSLLESVAVIGTIIPGSSVVVAAGVLIGLQVLDPWCATAVAVIGAILGDGFSFWLGRRYRGPLVFDAVTSGRRTSTGAGVVGLSV